MSKAQFKKNEKKEKRDKRGKRGSKSVSKDRQKDQHSTLKDNTIISNNVEKDNFLDHLNRKCSNGDEISGGYKKRKQT